MDGKVWRPLEGGYEISKDGYLRTTKYLRMIAPTIKAGRAPAYAMTANGTRSLRRITDIVLDVFGVALVVTPEMAEQMRSETMRHNETRGKWIDQRKAAAERKKQEAQIAAQVAEITQSIFMPPLKSDCPFPAMRPGITGYPTYDDPQIDPMSCGTWWVRIPMEDKIQTTDNAQECAA